MENLRNVRYLRVDNATEVKIPAKSGESHRIVEIFIDSPASDSYFDVVIGTNTVARIPVKLGDSLYVAPHSGSLRDYSIIALCKDVFGEEFDLEADQDEDITLKFSAAQGTVHVFYEVGRPGIDKTRLGRSASETIPLFAIVTHSAEVTASGNYDLDQAVVPLGFPEIKDGYVVPSGRTFQIRALSFGASAVGDSKPTYVHIYDETYEFFDPITHKGVSVEPGKNVLVTDIKTLDIYKIEPYAVLSGHKLTLNIDCEHDGTNNIPAGTEKLVLIGLWTTGR